MDSGCKSRPLFSSVYLSVGLPEQLTWRHLARYFTPDEAKAETVFTVAWSPPSRGITEDLDCSITLGVSVIKYIVTATVNQVVTKEIQLLVEAVHPEEAAQATKDALLAYPEAISVAGVKRVLTAKAKYGLPMDIAILSIKDPNASTQTAEND
jgi:hypothetical protein